MCIAIYKPAGTKHLNKKMLRQCSWNNPDGMGVMWASRGTIQMYKTLDDFEKFYSVVNSLQMLNLPMVLHFRFTTHGGTNMANCHPFYVPNTNGELAMCHNGVISGLPDAKLKSDTRFFADVLSGLKDGWMYDITMISMLEEFLGRGNKVVYMDKDGEVGILNEKSGTWDEGVWYSNDGYKRDRWSYKGNTYSGWGWESNWDKVTSPAAVGALPPAPQKIGELIKDGVTTPIYRREEEEERAVARALAASGAHIDLEEEDDDDDAIEGHSTKDDGMAAMYRIPMNGMVCFQCAQELDRDGVQGMFDSPVHEYEECLDEQCANCLTVMDDGLLEAFYLAMYEADAEIAPDERDHVSPAQQALIDNIMRDDNPPLRQADGFAMSELVDIYDNTHTSTH